MSPEQRQEWEDDEDALRRETTEAHAPAPESTESDERAENAPDTIDPFYARRNSYRELILRHWRLNSDGYLWSTEDVLDAVTALADSELAEAKREIARLRADLTELASSDEVEVEGSFFQRADLPRILGNFMRSSADHAREAKALHLELAAAKRDIARLHRDALAEAQAYRAMFTRAQEAEAKVEGVETVIAKFRPMAAKNTDVRFGADAVLDALDAALAEAGE